MFGNGVRTGMENRTYNTITKILRALHRAPAVFFAEVAGTAAQGTAVSRIVTSLVQAIGSLATASVLFSISYYKDINHTKLRFGML